MNKPISHKMTILRILISILVLAAILLARSAQAGVNELQDAITYRVQDGEVISPEVNNALDSSSGDEMIPVIVTLKAQANFSSVIANNRSARLRIVIYALQNMASATQGRIIELLESSLAQGTVSQYESYWIFNGLAVTATQQVIDEMAALPEVALITLDETIAAPSGHEALGPPEANLDLVNAPELWHLGFQGQGIVVANMDTGVSLYHPELASRWRGGTNSWFDPYNQHADEPFDLNGHGTQTMGVMVAGDGDGTSLGVAPGAQWVAVKIFNDQGSASVSAIHSGFQWLLDPDGDPFTPDAPHVVNNSWTFQSPGCDLEFELDLVSLNAAGILPIFAAGNSGPWAGSSVSPSNNPSAFAVGSIDNLENISTDSSRGPSACGEAENTFPEIVAPGENIKTTDLYGLYTAASGTSLSAPHVSGGLALLLNAFPDLSASEQAAALINGAVDLGPLGADNDFGNGRLDAMGAYQWLAAGGGPTPTPDPTINLALNRSVTVSSMEDGNHDGSAAVDGDLSTFWQTARARGKNKLSSEWIQVDLGSSSTVGKVVLEWADYFATSYTIQISGDGVNWTVVSSQSSGDGGLDALTFTPAAARYLRLDSTAWSSGVLRNWLRELQVYSGSGSDPTPTPTLTPTPTATPTPTPTPTQPPGGSGTMHTADLDGFASTAGRNRWNASISILVHDENENPLSEVTVSGTWSGDASGNGTCITGGDGTCIISLNQLKNNVSSVTFSLDDLTHAVNIYSPADNHDPDGDGTTIVILQP